LAIISIPENVIFIAFYDEKIVLAFSSGGNTAGPDKA
jgi:hypothetical protein